MALYRLTKGNILKVLSSLRINRVSIVLSNIVCTRRDQEHSGTSHPSRWYDV